MAEVLEVLQQRKSIISLALIQETTVARHSGQRGHRLVVGFRHNLLKAVTDEPLYRSALDEFEDDGLEESQHRSKTFSKSLRLSILCFKFRDCALYSAKPLKDFRVVGFDVTMKFV